MSQWPMVKLGDVCTVVGGGTPKTAVPEYWGGTIPWLTPKDLSGNKNLYISHGERSITKSGLANSSATLLPKGTVLWSSRAPIGHVAIADTNVATNQGFKSFIPGPNVDSEYLAYILIFMKDQLQEIGTGATFKEVSAKRAKSIQIPLPTLEEQRRIASILGHSTLQNSIVNKTINKLNTARQGCIEKYVDDPSKTPRLDSLADLQGGLSLGKTREVNPVEVEYLRVANIQRNNLILDNLKTIRCTEKELERCTIKDGDILMLEANANPLEVGRAAVAKVGSRHLVFQNHLFRVRPTEVSPIVLNALLSSVSVRTQLLRLAKTTSGLNTMTISQARSLRIPLRDELTTREFERQLTRIEQQKKFLTEKQSLLEELHQSLATRAFAGQL